MKTPVSAKKQRLLYVIALEIHNDWKNINYAAAPYLMAMSTLDSIKDLYGSEHADDIVIRFLANAKTWHGETARRIKMELNSMVKGL